MDEFKKSGKGKIGCSDIGSGDPVVLIHGFLETKEIWSSFAAKLSSSFRVLAIDLPGHGESDPLAHTENPSIESIAEAIACLLRDKGLTKVFLTGHSLGGYVALAFAERYPELLSGFCLFNSHPFPDPQAAIDNRSKQIALVSNGSRDQFIPDSIRKMYSASNIQVFSRQIEDTISKTSLITDSGIIYVLKAMMYRPSRQTVVENGSVALLWIFGAKDNFINHTDALAKVSLPENSEAVILENSGHMGFIEEEDRSVKILTDFIRKLI